MNDSRFLRRSHLFVFTFLSFSLFAQYEEIGQFPTCHYTPEEYGGNPFVFGMALDSAGQLLVANYADPSLLKYDGVDWEAVDVENRIIWNVMKGQDDRMYVGSTDDLGYLRIDSLGRYRFESLLAVVLAQDSSINLGRIRQIIAQESFIYFRSLSYLVRYDVHTNTVMTWKSKEEHRFRKIFPTPDRLFVSVDKIDSQGYTKQAKVEIKKIA